MLTTRMSPKMSEKPLATMNSSPANVSPFSSVMKKFSRVVDGRAEVRRPPVAATELGAAGSRSRARRGARRRRARPRRRAARFLRLPRRGFARPPAERTYQSRPMRFQTALHPRRRLPLDASPATGIAWREAREEEEPWRTTAVIPYESLDPLTIGASGDDDKVTRDTLSLEIPDGNLLAAIYPDEPAPVGDATAAARAALESPVSGPRFSDLIASASKVAVIIDNQFRPDAAVEAPPARARRDRGGREAGGDRLRERQGLPDVRLGHRPEDRQGQPRAHGAARDRVPPERPTERRQLRVRRRLVARHAGLAAQGGRGLRREDHDRPGAVEPLGRGRRRQAHPPRRRLRRDDRVEPLRVRAVAADALRRVRGPDALGHRRGRDDVRPLGDDERRPRHARPRDRVHLRVAPRRASQGDRALQRDLRVRAPGHAGGHRDLRRLRADRPPLLPHGLGLHVGRLRRHATAARSSTARRRPASRRRSATSPASRSWTS